MRQTFSKKQVLELGRDGSLGAHEQVGETGRVFCIKATAGTKAKRQVSS